MADAEKLTLTVLRDECIGDGACCDEAPGTFELDGEGKAICLAHSPDERQTILEAAKACPTNAIVVVDKASGKKLWPED